MLLTLSIMAVHVSFFMMRITVCLAVEEVLSDENQYSEKYRACDHPTDLVFIMMYSCFCPMYLDRNPSCIEMDEEMIEDREVGTESFFPYLMHTFSESSCEEEYEPV